MEIKNLLEQTKIRRKEFLNAVPKDKRQLLKSYERHTKTAKFCPSAVAILLLLFAAAYVALGVFLPYRNHWIWNAVILGLLWIGCVVLAICVRAKHRKLADAIKQSIPEYVEELSILDAKLKSLKKAESKRAAAQKKSQRKQKKAEAMSKSAMKAEQAAKKAQNEVGL